MTDELFERMREELTEGHLVLDRIGAPREIQDGDVVRECSIAERILDMLMPQRQNVA